MPELQEQIPARPWTDGMPGLQEQIPARSWMAGMPDPLMLPRHGHSPYPCGSNCRSKFLHTTLGEHLQSDSRRAMPYRRHIGTTSRMTMTGGMTARPVGCTVAGNARCCSASGRSTARDQWCNSSRRGSPIATRRHRMRESSVDPPLRHPGSRRDRALSAVPKGFFLRPWFRCARRAAARAAIASRGWRDYRRIRPDRSISGSACAGRHTA